MKQKKQLFKLEEEQSQKARKYNKISYEERIKMIEAIKMDKKSYRKIGKQLGVSSSTVKMIVSKYQKTGTIFQKKEQKEKRQEKGNNPKQNKYETFNKNQNQNQTQMFAFPIFYCYPPNCVIQYQIVQLHHANMS